ncbi:MAG: peptide chain release factor 3, partial [bacterium]
TPPQLVQEVARRRTFAIISHPDAGKTTLTEKLLLYGGAIEIAGAVKARRAAQSATSDWMELEKQRGISITSTVLQFEYDGIRVNLLDTPGHQDFSEDTYRTLTAVDSAVMLVDGAKGVETQTRKLFAVCRRRGIPLFTFINKMDRPARDPFELLDEIENVLGITAVPVTWPIGTHTTFRGVYERATGAVHLFEKSGSHGAHRVTVNTHGIDDPALPGLIGEPEYKQLREELDLLDGTLGMLDMELFDAGLQTPVFFGSAVTNFGVEHFLTRFLELAPSPGALPTHEGHLDPGSVPFAGFIFKIQANMNKAHRDRIAFMRIAAGHFERGMEVTQARTGKGVRLNHPSSFFAQERSIVDEAWPGDVVGLTTSGQFRVGDQLYLGQLPNLPKMPQFPPEFFGSLRNEDTGKYKQFHKGLDELAEEGAIQVLRNPDGAGDAVLAAVGELQFQVVQYRLENEYGCTVRIDRLPYVMSRWLARDSVTDVSNIGRWGRTLVDRYGRTVLLFKSEWEMNYALEAVKGLVLSEIPPDAAMEAMRK